MPVAPSGLIPTLGYARLPLFVPERLEQQVPVPELFVALPSEMGSPPVDRFRAAVATAVERMKAGRVGARSRFRVLTARYVPAPQPSAVQPARPAAFHNFAVRLPDGERGMNGSYLMGASRSWCLRTEGRAFAPTRCR